MAEKMKKMELVIDGEVYEFDAGTPIEPGHPIPPNTVNSAAIQDEAVGMNDLSKEVKDQFYVTMATEQEVRAIVTEYNNN